MNEQIRTQLKKIIVANAKLPITEQEITDDTDLIEDLSFDSISIMMTVVAIEDYYQIVLDDDALVFSTVEKFGSLVQAVAEQVSQIIR